MGMVDRALSAWGGALSRTATGMFADRNTAQMAQGLLAGIFPGGTGYPPARGSRELLRAYATMPWLRAVVHKISDGIASVQWQVMAVKDPKNPRARRVKSLQRAHNYANRSVLLDRYRKAGELVELEEHPLLDALDASNPVLTGLTNRKLTQIYLELVGEFFWIKERGAVTNGRSRRKVVTGLWAVPPTWVIATPTPSRPTFRVSYRGWQREIPSTEIIWGTDPNPLDPYARGIGTAMTLADELETDEYAAKHCHDSKTEALTRRGWVKGLELHRDDEIATWNPALEAIEYQRPIGMTLARFSGTMDHWIGPTVDAMVTPTHRLWIQGGDGAWRFAQSQEAIEGGAFRWRDAGRYAGTAKSVQIPGVAMVTKRSHGSRGGGRPPLRGIDDPLTFDAQIFAPFLGYFVSEGSVDRAGLSIGQTEGRFVDAIRASLTIFPASWVRERTERTASGKLGYRFTVRHLGLAEWLRSEVGIGAKNKRVPSIVFEWPIEAQKAFITAMIDGDGSWARYGSSAKYFSASRGLTDDVQRLCVQIGWSSMLGGWMPHGRPEYYVQIRLGGDTRRLVPQQNWAVPAAYDGMVWCVTVPNERFFSRRNGRVMLGGNTRNFFLNRARPELIVTTDPSAGGASKDEFDLLKQHWLNETMGYNRAWKPFFVNRKLDIHELEQNFRNLQLVQLREHERNVIMQTWGLPPEILGVLASSNRATIEAADLFMARYILLPRLEFMRAILQERLAPEYDERIILHYVSPVADDREFKLAAMQAMPATPTVDEWREIQGLEPEEDEKVGSMHILTNTMEPVEQLEEAPPAPVLPPGGGFPPGGGAAKPKPAPAVAPPEDAKKQANGHRPGRWITLSRR